MALNIEKTNFVLFHSPRNKLVSQIILKFGKQKINQENSVKFLGLLLDSNLNWKAHITELSKKLSRTVGLFYKIRHYAPLETLKPLYYGIFFPFLSYGIHVWGLTNSTYFDLIFVLQKKVLKSITFNDITSPAMPIFRNLELLTLADIHNLQVVSFVYECVNGLSPSYFGDYFKTLSSTHAMGTHQATMGNLFLQRRNTDQYGIRSVQYSGVKLWNSVPAKIRVSTSVTKFKSAGIKKVLHFILFGLKY